MLLFSIESYAPFPTVTMQVLSKYMHNYISPNQRNNPNSQTLTWRQQGRKTPIQQEENSSIARLRQGQPSGVTGWG